MPSPRRTLARDLARYPWVEARGPTNFIGVRRGLRHHRGMQRIGLALLLCMVACADDLPAEGPNDVGLVRDSGTQVDASEAEDAAVADTGPRDSGAQDARPEDMGFADTGVPDLGTEDSGAEDSGVEDSGVEDSGPPDTGPADTGPPDTGVIDAGRPDAGQCDYLELTVCIVECAGANVYARALTDRNAVCPDIVRLLGNDYSDIRAAVTGEGCNSTCIYKPFQSVSFIDHCRRRNGYIVYRANDSSCQDLFEFSSGLFDSVADWQLATPCP